MICFGVGDEWANETSKKSNQSTLKDKLNVLYFKFTYSNLPKILGLQSKMWFHRLKILKYTFFFIHI